MWLEPAFLLCVTSAAFWAGPLNDRMENVDILHLHSHGGYHVATK